MKPTKTSNSLKVQRKSPLHNLIRADTLIVASIILFIAAIIWFFGPQLTLFQIQPLLSMERRIYLILFMFLLWALKILLIDLDAPDPYTFKDTKTREILEAVQKRFEGALRFLKKTPLSRQQRSTTLNQLPWYLLIGPQGAGKTTMLAQAGVNYILKRQLKEAPSFSNSENFDWWVTKDLTLIDVPGNFFCNQESSKTTQKTLTYPAAWRFFLRLTRKNLGKKSIHGIILALPLPEMISWADPKKYQSLIRQLFQRLYELKTHFPEPLPCYIVVTKCDLLSGFNQYFADLSDEEAAQVFGLSFSKQNTDEKATEFNEKFNSLIKKLNEQLIWRLHQERNPMARPAIKDFPLQMERLKIILLDFLRKFSTAKLHLVLQGVYLSSALQKAPPAPLTLHGEVGSKEKSVQLFTPPAPQTRAYFIKQFLTSALTPNKIVQKRRPIPVWQKAFSYAFAISIVACTVFLFGNDFRLGILTTQQVQDYIAAYQQEILAHPERDRLDQKFALLDNLSPNQQEDKFKLSHLFRFYSKKSQQNNNHIYNQALQELLIPEIKEIFENCLQNIPITQSSLRYRVLKAYLMLGNLQLFDANYIDHTLEAILENQHQPATDTHNQHVMLALNKMSQPIILNTHLINQSRRVLASLSSMELASVILKNMNGNNEKHLTGLQDPWPKSIPNIFTALYFPGILKQKVEVAAFEALNYNWVLADTQRNEIQGDAATSLSEQLRIVYLNQYIDFWENIIAQVKLPPLSNLNQADEIILGVIQPHSHLLKLLETVYENTYFEPILSSSVKLQTLGHVLAKNHEPDNLLNQIGIGLKTLHDYLQTVLKSSNARKTAFECVTKRMHTHDADALMQIRTLADKCPEPLKHWLKDIADQTWHLLMQEAANYIDLSWQENVIHFYQNDIADRYPFNINSKLEVELAQFTKFFGKPGILINFYEDYLQNFVEENEGTWRWKTIDNQRLPFRPDSLHQIQLAVQIHTLFFPNRDDKPLLQFYLRRYQFGNEIKMVKLNINNKMIEDSRSGLRKPHIFTWPDLSKPRITSVQMVMNNQQIIHRNFPGDWGWFRLVNQSFEGALTNKEMIINFSSGKQPAKYLLLTDKQSNPFLSKQIRQFALPIKLMS